MAKGINYLLLFLMWFVVAIFSQQYVSQRLNDDNAHRADKLASNQLNYMWEFDAFDDVVTSFQKDWQFGQGVVSSAVTNPEISLSMNGQIIDPMVHQILQLNVGGEHEAVSFKIEVSDQRLQQFFDSALIPLTALTQVLNLNQLEWVANEINGPAAGGVSIAWREIPPLDAMVIRFYFDQPRPFSLQSVQLQQDQSEQQPEVQSRPCVEVADNGLGCFITNQMKFLDQQQQRAGLVEQIMFTPSSSYPVKWWLFLAAGIAGLLAWNYQPSNTAGKRTFSPELLLLSVVVLLLVAGLHQFWLLLNNRQLMWLLITAVVGLLVVFHQHFKWPQKTAIPVWLISLLLAALMLLLGGFDVGFIKDLPMYLLWACFQQLLIGPAVSSTLYQRLGGVPIWTACVVGVLFSIIHAPNHTLMLATLVSGVAWSFVWLRYQNIYANVFSHALLALVFSQVMPVAWLGTASVGVFFF